MKESGPQLDRDSIMVLHGFFALPNREKLKVVEAMNEYFDSSEKERIRADYDQQFESLGFIGKSAGCKCCGRN